MSVNNHEPPPKKNDKPAVWDLVLKDIKERDSDGLKKYGVRLQPFNGRNSTVDLYQELLDGVVYCRQMIEERKEMVNLLKDILDYHAHNEIDSEIRNLLKSIGELK